MKVSIIRKNVKFLPDSSRVVARYFMNGEVRTRELVERILLMSNLEVNNTLEQINREFARRHRNISTLFHKHYEKAKYIIKPMKINEARSAFINYFKKQKEKCLLVPILQWNIPLNRLLFLILQ